MAPFGLNPGYETFRFAQNAVTSQNFSFLSRPESTGPRGSFSRSAGSLRIPFSVVLCMPVSNNSRWHPFRLQGPWISLTCFGERARCIATSLQSRIARKLRNPSCETFRIAQNAVTFQNSVLQVGPNPEPRVALPSAVLMNCEHSYQFAEPERRKA